VSRNQLYLLIILIAISPIFGVYLANLIGYHEPLDIVAEKLELNELEINWTPLKDYIVPGLPDWLGYIVAGFLGVGIIIFIGHIAKIFVWRKNR